MMGKLKAVKETVCTFLGKDWTVQEKVLVLVNCILAGAVLGMLLAPRKGSFTVGSFNGNNGLTDEDWEDEGWLDEED